MICHSHYNLTQRGAVKVLDSQQNELEVSRPPSQQVGPFNKANNVCSLNSIKSILI